jgi:hypothetical protein
VNRHPEESAFAAANALQFRQKSSTEPAISAFDKHPYG